ncbi:MAG: hypothetical protein AAFP78_09905, partial [Pseudomonadota bacterium]
MSDYAAQPPRITARRALFLYTLLLAPAFLNDFTFIALAGTQMIYVADYGWRALTLLVAFLLAKEIAFAKGVSRARPLASCLTALATLFAGLLIAKHVE